MAVTIPRNNVHSKQTNTHKKRLMYHQDAKLETPQQESVPFADIWVFLQTHKANSQNVGLLCGCNLKEMSGEKTERSTSRVVVLCCGSWHVGVLLRLLREIQISSDLKNKA